MSAIRELSAERAGGASLVDLVLLGWLAVAIAMTAGLVVVMGDRPFDSENQAWLSAHFATMARSFAAQGVAALRGVPIQNNPPLGTQPDAYIHWPPLFPIVLSFAYRLAGESERVTRAVMFALLAGIGGALFALVRAVATRRAALLAVTAFFLTPAIVEFGWTATHLPLAMLFHTLAVLAFVRAVNGERIERSWAGIGMAAMALAVLSSWEPLMAAVGLLVVARLVRSGAGFRLALAYLGVGVALVALVLADYVVAYPFLFADLLHTVLFRLGVGFHSPPSLPIHAFVDRAVYENARPGPVQLLSVIASRHVRLGSLSLLAMGGVLTWALLARGESARRIQFLCAGLFAPWLLWTVLMSHHVFFHDYEILIATPFAAACLGIALAAVLDSCESAPASSGRRSFAWLAWAGVPAVLLGSAIDVARTEAIRRPPPTGLVEYATDITTSTPGNAVVLSPEISMVPVYYSRRHLVRGITDDAVLAKAREALRGVFPGSPVYLALRPDHPAGFDEALKTLPESARTPHLILLAVPGP